MLSKLFTFTLGEWGWHMSQQVVVQAETRDEAHRLLVEKIVHRMATETDFPWCVSDIREEVEEVDGPVAFTYGVDG